MLYIGEKVGMANKSPNGRRYPEVDIAVDPLEGTNLCATGAPNALAVLAASEAGGLLHAPDIYMEKLVVGPSSRDVVDLDAPVRFNLRAIAQALGRRVEDLVVIVLDRPRHEKLIAEIREAGARIRLIGDGDLSAGIAAAVVGSGVHAVMGIGGAPEGVLTAAAMRCLNGEIFARLVIAKPGDEERSRAMGITDLKKVYRSSDLAPGKSIIFAATGVTEGSLMKGVRAFRRRHADDVADHADEPAPDPLHRQHPRVGLALHRREDSVLAVRSFVSQHVERAALVGLVTPSSRGDADHSLDELAGLADAAGARVVMRMLQERPRPDAATFIGSGKVASLAAACDEADVDVVIFDNELTPAQLRQLEKNGSSARSIDRTQLILDIFARRARTREGKWQVELAQLKYLLPRLAGSATALSRLGGGIGTRGPGETKLESDRRRIRVRIQAIQREIDQVRQRRSQLRERRQKQSVPTVALVGYTNAGKTTLFNRLTNETAVASDALVRHARSAGAAGAPARQPRAAGVGHCRIHRSAAARAGRRASAPRSKRSPRRI